MQWQSNKYYLHLIINCLEWRAGTTLHNEWLCCHNVVSDASVYAFIERMWAVEAIGYNISSNNDVSTQIWIRL